MPEEPQRLQNSQIALYESRRHRISGRRPPDLVENYLGFDFGPLGELSRSCKRVGLPQGIKEGARLGFALLHGASMWRSAVYNPNDV